MYDLPIRGTVQYRYLHGCMYVCNVMYVMYVDVMWSMPSKVIVTTVYYMYAVILS